MIELKGRKIVIWMIALGIFVTGITGCSNSKEKEAAEAKAKEAAEAKEKEAAMKFLSIAVEHEEPDEFPFGASYALAAGTIEDLEFSNDALSAEAESFAKLLMDTAVKVYEITKDKDFFTPDEEARLKDLAEDVSRGAKKAIRVIEFSAK